MPQRPFRRPELTTAVDERDDVVVVDLTGEIRMGRGDVVLRELLEPLLDQSAQHVVVRLDAVKLIDSAGLGELMAFHHRIRQRGRRFAVANQDPWIRDLLSMTRLDTIFPVTDTIDEALDLIHNAPESRFVASEQQAPPPVGHDAWPVD